MVGIESLKEVWESRVCTRGGEHREEERGGRSLMQLVGGLTGLVVNGGSRGGLEKGGWEWMVERLRRVATNTQLLGQTGRFQ